MKKLITLIIAGLFSFGLYAQMDHSGHKMGGMKKAHGAKVQLSHKSKMELQAVLAANEKLHNSFFKYNAAQVESNAKALSVAIDKISETEIAKLLKFSKSKLSEITAAKDRKENNKNYNLVSMALLHVINKYDVGTQYKGYFCPMVKMKWIQDTKKGEKVLNPYAPEMPNCGGKL